MYEPFSPKFIANIEANRTVKDELLVAASKPSSRRRISVTDLVNLRQAYFRRTRPDVEIPLDRRQKMWAGTGFHELFGAAVSSEEYLEQFLELDGIVGKVDIFEDEPVELKTTSFMPKDIGGRSSYIDQLGMYCAMARKRSGQLLVYQRAVYGREPVLRAWRAEFRDLDTVAIEMRARRDLFAEALEKSDPGALPQCEWYSKGCDYTAVCGCETAVPGEPLVGPDDYQLREDAALAEEFMTKMARGRAPTQGFGIHHLVFPRKSLLERQARAAGEEDEGGPDMAGMERRGFQLALLDALRYGVPGAFKGLPVRLGSLKGVVRTYRGVPTLFRSSRFREMVERHRLPNAQPHYFDRLAFDCALAGQSTGRLVLYYENIPSEKFMVYDVHLKDIEAILREAGRRLELLECGGPPEALPACPDWMSKFCPHAATCGCGDTE
jgi:hypothetical protein